MECAVPWDDVFAAVGLLGFFACLGFIAWVNSK